MRIPIIFSIIMIIYGAIQWYIGWHGWILLNSFLDIKYSWIWIYGLIIAFVSFGFIIGRVCSRFMPYTISKGIKIIGAYWLVMVQYGVILLPLADLSGLMLRLASFDSTFIIRTVGAVVLVILTFIMLKGSWNAWSPIVRKYHILVPHKRGDQPTLKIAVASDLHLGCVVGKRHLQRLVNHMQSIQPDLILLPGDVLDDDITPFIHEGMADVLGQLKAPHGVFAVLGNHEYYGKTISRYISEMKKIGIRVLQDESVHIAGSYYVIGRKDRIAQSMGVGGRKSHEELVQELDPAQLKIMMDHQPYQYDQAVSQGIDVILSGHTHRGQLAPNHWITKRLFELDYGYMKKGTMHAFVSSGFGVWGPPIRIGSRSEILQIEIKQGGVE